MKFLLTLLLLTFTLSGIAQKQILALKLSLDSTYYLVTNANMTITEDIPGQPQVITTILGGKIAHKVTAIRDSVYDMEVVYKSLVLHMQLPGGKSLNFDTDNNDDQDVFSKVMKRMVNKPFNMTINKRGKILALKNIETLYDNLMDDFPQITPEKKTQVINQLKQSFGESAFKGNFQDAFAVYPDKPVAVNEQWSAVTGWQSIVEARIKTTYILNSVDNRYLVIHGDADVSSNTKSDFKQMNGVPMRVFNLKGTVTSDIKLNKATGWIKEAKVAKLVKNTIEIKDNPKTPGGVTFLMTVAGDLTTTDK